jgi:hypothetical protein
MTTVRRQGWKLRLTVRRPPANLERLRIQTLTGQPQRHQRRQLKWRFLKRQSCQFHWKGLRLLPSTKAAAGRRSRKQCYRLGQLSPKGMKQLRKRRQRTGRKAPECQLH